MRWGAHFCCLWIQGSSWHAGGGWIWAAALHYSSYRPPEAAEVEANSDCCPWHRKPNWNTNIPIYFLSLYILPTTIIKTNNILSSIKRRTKQNPEVFHEFLGENVRVIVIALFIIMNAKNGILISIKPGGRLNILAKSYPDTDVSTTRIESDKNEKLWK